MIFLAFVSSTPAKNQAMALAKNPSGNAVTYLLLTKRKPYISGKMLLTSKQNNNEHFREILHMSTLISNP